jgi:acyl carrier protein
MAEVEGIREILRQALHLGPRADDLRESTPLLGHFPELDSMALLAVLTAIEERYGIVVDDGDLSADTFRTVGTLARFVETRLG